MNGLKLIFTAALVAVNAFFVIAEYALVRSRRARLEVMREENARGAALALDQIGNVNQYISAVQIGVTVCSIGIGALGQPALAALLKGALGNTLSHGVSVVVCAVVAFAVIASVQLVAGEMVPKFYAIDRSESVARRVARPLQAFSVLFRPFVVALTAVADRILRLLGVDMSFERSGGSSEELKRLIAESFAGGQIDPGEAGMLSGVFHLHDHVGAAEHVAPAGEDLGALRRIVGVGIAGLDSRAGLDSDLHSRLGKVGHHPRYQGHTPLPRKDFAGHADDHV